MNVDRGGEWLDDVVAGFTAYYLTSLPVFLGVLFAIDFPHPGKTRSTPSPDFASACFHLDADHYLEIVRQGYSYDPKQRSMVAFFPAYPLLSRWLSQEGLSIGIFVHMFGRLILRKVVVFNLTNRESAPYTHP